MAEDFKEKLKGISFPRKMGATEHKPVINEDNGKVVGRHDVRWDGSQDANIEVQPVRASFRTQEEE